jgi:hypothetical protein
MVSLDKKLIAKTEPLVISGWGAPRNKMEVLSDGSVVGTGTVSKNGSYAVIIGGGKLSLGPHKIQARQVDDATGKTGDISSVYTVTVGQFAFASVDMNNDSKIDISDWSIFSYNWSSPNKEIKIKNDLNNDNVVDVVDFSIFLTSFQTYL